MFLVFNGYSVTISRGVKINMNKLKMRFLAVGLMISLIMGMATPIVTLAEETKGNTIGNLNHFGKIVKDGEWLYMQNEVGPNIRKVKIDGSESKDLIVSGYCVGSYDYNIADGWIYYTKTVYNADFSESKTYICKQEINGGKETELCSAYSFGGPMGDGALYVCDEWIYYIGAKGNYNCIYRMKTDGTKKKAIVRTKSILMSFCIADQWIYYIDCSNGLYKVKLDGTSKKCLKKGSYFQSCDVFAEWIFYNVDNQVYKMKKDGSNHQKFLSNARKFNINNGWVYYDSAKGLYKIQVDGRSKKLIVNAGTLLNKKINYIGSYSIVDDRIYFDYSEKRGPGTPSFCARVNVDGTDLQSGWLPRKPSSNYDDPLHQYFDTPIDPSLLMDPSDIPDPKDIFDPIDLEDDSAFWD